jgi:hypothetical protein
MSGIMSMLLGAVSSAAAAVDEFFNRVTLLLPGDGTNGAQNNTFLDSSSNNFTITRNGNTTQGTFSPFSQTGWSNFFGGTGNYATSTSSAIATSTTTFTIEGWIYATATPVTASNIPSVIADCTPASTQLFWGFGPLANGTLSFYWYDGASKSVTGNTTIALNTWAHIAISVNANAITLYVNGTQQTLTGTTTLTNRSGSTATPITFAQFSTGGSYFTGYISNFSVLSGTAKYSTSFTPSTTPLATGTTNQVLLFAAGNRFADFNTATTAKTFTITGTPSVQAFSPFAPTAAYSAATVGGSGYFDGSDYLTVAGGSSLAFGSGDFSLEAFVYPTVSGSTMKIYDARPNTTAGNYPVLHIASNNAVFFVDVTTLITGTLPVPANAWTHILVSRVSGNLRLFVNGVQDGSTVSNSTNFANATARPAIAVRGSTLANDFLTGYISSVRVLIGSGFTSVTVPTAPLTAITNTSLLLNYTNAGITDATAKNVLETVDNAQISTTQSKWGNSSIFLDGTGDYLNLPTTNQSLTFGSANWTIEFWIYVPTLPSARREILYLNGNTSGYAAVALHICTNNKLGLSFSENGSSWRTDDTTGVGNALTAATWQYVALTRNGQNIQIYLDGAAQGSAYTTTAATTSLMTTYTLNQIGAYNSASFRLTAYIDDLRITLGQVRTVTTSPTSAFPLQ